MMSDVILYRFERERSIQTYRHFNILTHNVFCTKIASKLIRTYTDKHGLPNLCRELLSVELSKEQQSSDWGADTLSESQKHYAASDVIYLHGLHDILQERLIRENRYSVAEECFKFLPFRAKLDCMGWEYDIFDWGTKY
jgi:ribonuclease D